MTSQWKWFPYHWPFVRGIYWSPVDASHKGVMMHYIPTWLCTRFMYFILVNSLRTSHMCVCVGNLIIIASDNNGLSPSRHQAFIWTSAGILLLGRLETNSSEMLIAIHSFSFKNIHFKRSSAKWRPFCLGLNVLIIGRVYPYLSRLFHIHWYNIHDDVIKWKHFPCYCPLCGNSPFTGEFPS